MRPLAAIALLGAAVALSCGRMPRTAYYTLSVSPASPASDPKTNFSLGVEHFRATQILRDDRIVYYTSPTELGFYQFHRWSADPATMLTERVARRLSEMGIFAQVRLLPSREPLDYTLKGRLMNFEEVDYGGGGKGRVALELALVRLRDRHVVWSFVRQAEHRVEENGMGGVVKALNASSEDLVSQAARELAEQVEREFKESQTHPQSSETK